MPAKNKTAVTTTQRQAIAMLRSQGLSNRAIGDKLNLHHITVSKAFTAFMREASQIIDDAGRDWRRNLRNLAIRAVARALEDESEKYKAGNLGANVLRGLAEFQRDGSTVNFTQLANSVPESYRERYLGKSDDQSQTATDNETDIDQRYITLDENHSVITIDTVNARDPELKKLSQR